MEESEEDLRMLIANAENQHGHKLLHQRIEELKHQDISAEWAEEAFEETWSLIVTSKAEGVPWNGIYFSHMILVDGNVCFYKLDWFSTTSSRSLPEICT